MASFAEKNLAICHQVRHALRDHPRIKTQKDLALALGKKPSEVSRWLSGAHNIGLENITKMEAALGQDLILTDEQARKKYASVPGGHFTVFRKIVQGRQSMQRVNPIELRSSHSVINRFSKRAVHHSDKKLSLLA